MTARQHSGAEPTGGEPGTVGGERGAGGAGVWGQLAARHVAYRAVRESVSALLAEYPRAAGVAVPSCPGWTVREVVAHLLVICQGVAGRTPEQGPPRGELELEGLLARWAREAGSVESLLASGAAGTNGILVMDAFSHELDIRAALGSPPPARHPAASTALWVACRGFAASVRDHGLPPLLLRTPGTGWATGARRPDATLAASRLDLLRALTGRRTPEQIVALGWDRDPAPWLPAFSWGPFTPPRHPVE